MTYQNIYNQFRLNNPEIEIIDYRPCCELYDVPNLDNAIVMWLRNGTKIIYIKS